ncbi:MAG TPA: EF-P lysine aminoacylase EpmA [Pirellulales bacterium]|nr:EF-P lysine aminoacylase EpmA [Pirellulales bacterium]
MTKDQCDYLPSASWPVLRLRATLLRTLREFFHQHGFLEVETPILSADVVVDRHLEPFLVDFATGAGTRRMWLQTSPEFGMKRLLAAGGVAIYQVTRAFRQAEQGPRHNPEFTIVEWYRRGDGPDEAMRFLAELCEVLLGLAPAERLSYQAAFERHVGVDPHTADVARLEEVARGRGLSPPASMDAEDRDLWLDFLLVEFVEPRLGQDRPVILYDYPASQAALAHVRPGPPAMAERFELYVAGIELANGYHELLDASVLRQRNRTNNATRRAEGKPSLPEASRLLAAMDHGLPACAGVALGFDRVVMLAAGAASLDEVLAFPFDRA